MLQYKSFDAVVAMVADGTKAEKINLYHTWDGWISKGVLHITSRSGARTRDVWHFPVAENTGGRMFFKNTAREAYCYVRRGAKNVLEEQVWGRNPHCRFDYVAKINVHMRLRGEGCGHCTRDRPQWFVVLTDGNLETTRQADVVERWHPNQDHRGCPTESDTVLVSGGTYALEMDVGQNRSGVIPTRIVVGKGADLEHIKKLLEAERTGRRWAIGLKPSSHYAVSPDNEEARREIGTLTEEVDSGYPYPEHIRRWARELAEDRRTRVFVPEDVQRRLLA